MTDDGGLYRTVEAWEVGSGVPAPLGATWIEGQQAYNFALYSRHATGVTLLLYREDAPETPVLQLRLDPRVNKSGRIWHFWLPASDTQGATLYAYRIEGPYNPMQGHRFNPDKILLDPFAQSVFFPPGYSRAACRRPGPTDGVAPLGVLPRQEEPFDWGNEQRPRHTHDTVIYELHVKGFTARPNSDVTPERRGTFLGLIEKIPYLQELGVTVVELLPVHQYDPQEGNYWGYMTLNFFAPHRDYAVSDPVAEFRSMVKAFHAAGIEVWLDVVYNHTSEGDERGPSYSFRGIDNRSYYLLDNNSQAYCNDTGCGNTLRCAHPVVRALITESLHHWAVQMRVDGFRFDLASIFTRNHDGTLNLEDPPLIAEISEFGYHTNVRLVAEAWDIGSYQLGQSFPGLAWRQWNGKFRDDIRAFIRGDQNKIGALMQRIYGSDDLFPDSLYDAYRPFQSINFITAHDGFCLYDLVSYHHKRNWANGNNNADGSDDNISWNCGWEGDDGVPDAVLALRKRQIKNMFAILMLSNGTPMFCAGDEFLNTQRGNNNPYNQDNEISWLDWDLLEKNRDMFRFFKHMIGFRKAHRSISRRSYWRDDVRWYGVGAHVDLAPSSHCVAFYLDGASVGDGDLYVMINGYSQELPFTIQEGQPGEWLRVTDTSLPNPEDVLEPGQEARVDSERYRVAARSVVVLYRPPASVVSSQ